ncbi:MAG: DUF397 domain-containing protein [Dehalococcoidia bacterium]
MTPFITNWKKSTRSGSTADCVEVGTTPDLTWRKSTRSGAQADCVEVATAPSVVGVRDSKDRTGPALMVAPAEWDAFLDGVKQGEFDQL